MSQAATALPGAAAAPRIDGTTLGLYVATVFLWGVSWIGIKAQVGVVAPEMSVLWRFLLAALVTWGWVLATGHRVRFAMSDHLRFVVVGCCLFSFNFVSFYYGAIPTPSGLLSVVFSLASIFNLALGFIDLPAEGGAAAGAGRRAGVFRHRAAVLAADRGGGLQRRGACGAWRSACSAPCSSAPAT
jgi:hypothetical protein